MSSHKQNQFFLGSNTKRGFVSLFDQLWDPDKGYRLYILKGGPGSGKSSLMRRIAKTLEEKDHVIEYIPCASDPQSLDAIIDYEAKIAMVDGTAPHTLDPKYPGAYDLIINLGDVWDQDTLVQNKKKIIELSDIISNCHSMATSCITSATALLDNNISLAKPFVNLKAIDSFIEQLEEELDTAVTGKEKKRLLSAVSVGQIEFFEDTLTNLCPQLYAISDNWGASSQILLNKLREFALSKNLEFITCYCSIQNPDKIDHIIFPSAGIGVSTSNIFHTLVKNVYTPVDGLMYPIESYKFNTMVKNLSIAKQLIDTASEHVAQAKRLHDDLEAFYIDAMDFSKVDDIYDRLMGEILNSEYITNEVKND